MNALLRVAYSISIPPFFYKTNYKISWGEKTRPKMANLQLTNKISDFVLRKKRFSCNIILPKLITFHASQHLHYTFITTKNTLFESKRKIGLRGALRQDQVKPQDHDGENERVMNMCVRSEKVQAQVAASTNHPFRARARMCVAE